MGEPRAAATRQTGGMLDTSVIPPAGARTFTARRRVRLSDMDAAGRVRLDAVARFLQDAAIDDVQETGWGTPEHLWVIRRIQVDVVSPLLHDRELEIATWCSGVAAIAAGRRWSVGGDAGGRVEIDSVWIHLGPDQRPARIGDFGPYGVAAAGRSVSTKLALPDPPADAVRSPWALRSTDLDAQRPRQQRGLLAGGRGLARTRGGSLAGPYRAELDYREPIDLDDESSSPFHGGDEALARLRGGRAGQGGGVGRAAPADRSSRGPLARGRLPLPLGAAVAARQRRDDGTAHDSPSRAWP